MYTILSSKWWTERERIKGKVNWAVVQQLADTSRGRRVEGKWGDLPARTDLIWTICDLLETLSFLCNHVFAKFWFFLFYILAFYHILCWLLFSQLGSFLKVLDIIENSKVVDQDGRHSEILTQFPRNVALSHYYVDLEECFFIRNIFPP